MIRGFVALLVLAVATIAPAWAMPGQSLGDFERWAHGNATLHDVQGQSALDGTVTYSTSFRAAATTATFSATSDTAETQIVRESIVYAAPDDYRLDRHRETAARLLSAVYGSIIADDFRSAKVAASGPGDLPTVAYRGDLYGYEASGQRVTVRRLADFDLDLVCIEADDCPIGD